MQGSWISAERLDNECLAKLETENPKNNIPNRKNKQKIRGREVEGEGAEAPTPARQYLEKGGFFWRVLMGVSRVSFGSLSSPKCGFVGGMYHFSMWNICISNLMMFQVLPKGSAIMLHK